MVVLISAIKNVGNPSGVQEPLAEAFLFRGARFLHLCPHTALKVSMAEASFGSFTAVDAASPGWSMAAGHPVALGSGQLQHMTRMTFPLTGTLVHSRPWGGDACELPI